MASMRPHSLLFLCSSHVRTGRSQANIDYFFQVKKKDTVIPALVGTDDVKHTAEHFDFWLLKTLRLIFTPGYLRYELPLLRHWKSCMGVWLLTLRSHVNDSRTTERKSVDDFSRAATIGNFWRQLIIGKIITIDKYIVYFFFFMLYNQSIMSFNDRHSVVASTLQYSWWIGAI